MKKKPLTYDEQVKELETYIAFLKKALDSKNFKAFATPEQQEKYKTNYDRAKFRLKTLKAGK